MSNSDMSNSSDPTDDVGLDLDLLEKLERAATPTRWRATQGSGVGYIHRIGSHGPRVAKCYLGTTDKERDGMPDAQFLVALRNSATALIARARDAARLEASGAAQWEADHQRAALEHHNLMDLYMGCDSIDQVCEALSGARSERNRLRTDLDTLTTERDAIEDQAAVMRVALTSCYNEIRAWLEHTGLLLQCERALATEVGLDVTPVQRAEKAEAEKDVCEAACAAMREALIAEVVVRADGGASCSVCFARCVGTEELHHAPTCALAPDVGTPLLTRLREAERDRDAWKVRAEETEMSAWLRRPLAPAGTREG